jgi:ectoine hydroxylase-related dioxygenase (phytanoyl-CoA dioxygenase family)
MTELEDNGYLILRGFLAKNICDEMRDIIKSHADSRIPKQRMVNLHIDEPYLQKFCCHSLIKQVLDNYLDDAVCYTSLSFVEGTQQNIHRDVPHFFSRPMDSFYGVWVALESANLSNGALEYYPESHKVDVMSGRLFAKSVLDISSPSKQQVFSLLPQYEKYCENQYIKAGLEKKAFIANKGDVIIWHPRLAHGGGDYAINGNTRYSIVTHWKEKTAPIWMADKFFSISSDDLPDREYKHKTSKTGVEYVDLHTVYNQGDYI